MRPMPALLSQPRQRLRLPEVLFVLLVLPQLQAVPSEFIEYTTTNGGGMQIVTTKIMSLEPGSDDNTAANRTCKLAGPHGMQLVPGTSLVLVADTDNSLIRMVDLGFSQASQTIRIPYTNTPYAIKLHHDQRQLYVVNLKNGTVSVTDLYSMSSYILATGLGMPTDVVVHPPTGRIFVADGQNHTLWVVDETDGSVSWFCGANDPAEGYYLEGNASDARFWVPLGLTYDSKRDVVYVADFRNRVIRSQC